MRNIVKAIATLCVTLMWLGGCGSSDKPSEATSNPPLSAVPAEPTATTVPAEPTATTVPAEPTATTVPAQVGRQPLPPRAELPPGSYEVVHGDTAVWLDIPDLGDDIGFLSPPQTEWQVTIILIGESAGIPEPAFGLAWAEDGATVESVVEAIRVTDADRHSVETSTGVFQGIETTIITRVSEIAENSPFDNSIITVSTGDESKLQNLYAHEWTIENHVFERDGRVMIVSYEWPAGQREMLLAEAAPVVESFELRSAD